MKGFQKIAAAAVVAGSLALGAYGNSQVPQTNLENKVRHELLMLPYVNVFENLTYSVNDGVVTLSGQVTQPVTSRTAESVVKHIPGVTAVNNQIEVLPLSSFDDRIRLATLNAIYRYAPLQRYGMGTQPSIRILVKNGNVTLAGVVRTETDRNLAFVRANGVAGTFSVKNELQVEDTHVR